MRWGVYFPRGTNNPRVEEFPLGDKTSGVTLKGDGVTGTDWQGQVGGGNSSATWDTKGITATCHGEEMEIEMEPVAPPITLWGTEELEKGKINMLST